MRPVPTAASLPAGTAVVFVFVFVFAATVIAAAIIMPAGIDAAYGHTVDSVQEYRVEIGWMNEPVVSGDTNAIEIYVSPLEPGLDLEDQQFKDGITGLEETLTLTILHKGQSIILKLSPDHNIPGKYYAFVNPTVSAFYQVNLAGMIVDAPVSLSMHPPKVHERAYIEFPKPVNADLNAVLDEHDTMLGRVQALERALEQSAEDLQAAYEQAYTISVAGVLAGLAGIATAGVAITRARGHNNSS